MKNIWKGLLAVAALFVAGACSEDTGMNVYPGRSNEAFFSAEEFSYMMGVSDPTTYKVQVYRANKNGNASAAVKLTTDPGCETWFSGPAAVEFTDGAITAEYTITIDREKLTRGVQNTVTLEIEGGTDLLYATSCAVSITRDYDWAAYVTGTFTSDWWEEEWPQELQRVDLGGGNLLYRFPDLYAQGEDVRFTIANGKVVPVGTIWMQYTDPTYGPVFFQLAASMVDEEAKTIMMGGYYRVQTGSFGSGYEKFTW